MKCIDASQTAHRARPENRLVMFLPRRPPAPNRREPRALLSAEKEMLVDHCRKVVGLRRPLGDALSVDEPVGLEFANDSPVRQDLVDV